MPFYRHKIFIPILAAAFSLSMSACSHKKEDTAKKGPVGPKILNAEGFVVKAQVYTKTYTASGSLLPNEQIDIHPEVSGRVTSILFKEGVHVRKGQVLLHLNDADIKATIQKLVAQKNLQKKTLERQDQLLKIGGISKQDFETTQTQIASIDADIAFNQAQLQKTVIVAPFEGVVGIRNISVGAIVSQTTIVASLQQTNPLKMDFSIPDQYRSDLKVGKLVKFTVDGVQDTMEGKIIAVDPGADATTRTIKARAAIPNASGKLVAGSFAHVAINFGTDNTAILIPSQAVIPTTRDKKVAIARNGRAKIVIVQLGDRTADKVEVTKGLQPGDTVITTGIMQVKNDSMVKITKVKG